MTGVSKKLKCFNAPAASARTLPPYWYARCCIAPPPPAASSPAMSASRRCPTRAEGMDRDRSISRAGNPRARTTLIQLAWLWLRYQPASALAAWVRARVGSLQGRTRRIAIVAMARKLLIALWRYVETGVMPEGIEIRTQAEITA